MAATGQVPYRLGVLKIDTEGNDLQVLRGLGDVSSDVVVVEFWDGLEDSLGRCPYTLADIARELRARKYGNFAAIKRYDEFELVQLNSDVTQPGDWGNAIFVHDHAFERLGSVLFEAAATAGLRLIDQALRFRTECAARLEVIEDLQQNLALRSPSGGGESEYDLRLLQRLNNHADDITPPRDRAELHKGAWPDNGVFVGRGWYPLEHFDGATFRWVDREAEIVISRPTAASIEVRIDLEIGPGAGREPLEVRALTKRGAPIVAGCLSGREVLTVRLPTTPGVALDVFRLTPTGGGYVTRDDPRRLNFRVFSVTPVPSPEA